MSFFSCTTSHFGIRSFLEHDFKSHKDSDGQLNVDLAQSVEDWHDDQEVLSSIPTGAIFWLNLFCSCPCKPLLATL